MSEESTETDVNDTDVNDTESTSVKNPDAVLRKNRELLGSNKKLKDQLTELTDRLKAIESEKLSAQGKKDEQIQLLAKQLGDAQTKAKKMEAHFAYQVVTNKVKAKADQLGCRNSDHLIRSIDLSNLSVDAENGFAVADEEINEVLTEAKKSYPYMFEDKTKTVKDRPPVNGAVKTKKPVTQMTREEIMAQIKSLSST